MSLVKAKLKLAREALGKKQYAAAKDAAEQALAFDPTNYNACVRPCCLLARLTTLLYPVMSSSASRCWSSATLRRASK
jgi:hypothetical protein